MTWAWERYWLISAHVQISDHLEGQSKGFFLQSFQRSGITEVKREDLVVTTEVRNCIFCLSHLLLKGGDQQSMSGRRVKNLKLNLYKFIAKWDARMFLELLTWGSAFVVFTFVYLCLSMSLSAGPSFSRAQLHFRCLAELRLCWTSQHQFKEQMSPYILCDTNFWSPVFVVRVRMTLKQRNDAV